MENFTEKEINLMVTLLTRFLMKESATFEEFKTAQSIIEKLSEN